MTLLFAELEATAAEQTIAFVGTPGSITERSNDSGTIFWVHRYSDAIGRRCETYLGKTDDEEVAQSVMALRARIEATNAAITRIRLLARAGFATVDRKTFATLASLHNHGLFRAGALLIGSQAYGALLNALGVKTVPYATEDVDIARREQLALEGLPSFLEMLRQTGVDFLEVPSLDRNAPSSSFLERGGSRLRVDLLVPSKDNDYPIIPVPELKAHAKGLPYLSYLLGASQEVPVLSPHGVVMVRVPVPERYAVHKMIVSQLRAKTSSKPEKDLQQAATLIEALTERFPNALEDALEAAPRSAARHLTGAAKAIKRYLPASTADALDSARPKKSRK